MTVIGIGLSQARVRHYVIYFNLKTYMYSYKTYNRLFANNTHGQTQEFTTHTVLRHGLYYSETGNTENVHIYKEAKLGGDP